MKFLLLFIFLILITVTGWAQSNPDSIQIRIDMSTGVAKAEALADGVILFLRSDLKKAQAYADQTHEYAQQENDKVLTAYAWLNDGLLKASRTQLDSAIQVMENARKMVDAEQNVKLLIRVGLALGRTYMAAGYPERALTNLYETLQLLEKDFQPETELKVRTNITWAYLELKRYRDCVVFGKKSLPLIPDKFAYILPYITNNMAASYGAMKQLDSARFYVMKGLPIADARKDYNLVANAYFILGSSYSEAGEFALAIEQFQKAKPYREKLGNPFYIVSDLYVLSDLYYKKGDYANGIKSGMEALVLAEKNNLTLKFEGIYQGLARNYEAAGDFKNSSKYYGLLAAAKDSVYQRANTEAMANMQTKYETEKKEQQITLLDSENKLKEATIERNYFLIGGLMALMLLGVLGFYLWRYRDQQKQKAILQEQKERLREAQLGAVIDSQEKERKRFASDLHDGMGQLISALQLNINAIRNNRTPETRDNLFENSENILTDIHNEIRNIAFNLMPPVLIKEGLISGLNELIRRINKAGTVKVGLSQHDMPARFNDVGEISLYRIIQELLSNIVKHSQATRVTLDFTGFDDEVVLTIEDDGIGYSLEKFQNNEGNGWRNISSRLNLIKATIDFDVVEGRKNNTVIIAIPLSSIHASIKVNQSQNA